MAYRALKPCRFAGKDYRVGESVPEAAVASAAKKRLLSAGILAPGAGEPEPRQPSRAPVPRKTGGKTEAGEGK